jgi:hypothetical protein
VRSWTGSRRPITTVARCCGAGRRRVGSPTAAAGVSGRHRTGVVCRWSGCAPVMLMGCAGPGTRGSGGSSGPSSWTSPPRHLKDDPSLTPLHPATPQPNRRRPEAPTSQTGHDNQSVRVLSRLLSERGQPIALPRRCMEVPLTWAYAGGRAGVPAGVRRYLARPRGQLASAIW